MGCCSPNREKEHEFINNSSQFNKKSFNENFTSLLNNDNFNNFNILKHSNQNDIVNNIIINEKNIEENSEKIKLEKENEKEKDKEDSRFSLISSEKNNTTKITNSDYENVISLYPSLTTENPDKIEVKKI